MCRDKITIKGTDADRIQYRECNNNIIYYYDNKIYYSLLLLQCVCYTHTLRIPILHIDLTSGLLSIKGIFLVYKQNCDTPPSNITPWVIYQEYSLWPSSSRILLSELRSSLSLPIFCSATWSEQGHNARFGREWSRV